MKFKLKQITGINLTNIQNDDILQWDSSLEEFINVDPSAISTQDLESVLNVGNITGGNDILISDEDNITGVLNTNWTKNSIVVGINNTLGTSSNINVGSSSIIYGEDNDVSGNGSVSQHNLIGGLNNTIDGFRNILSGNSNILESSSQNILNGNSNDIDSNSGGLFIGNTNILGRTAGNSSTTISNRSYILGDNNTILVRIGSISRNIVMGTGNLIEKYSNSLVNSGVFGRNNTLTSNENNSDSSFIFGNNNYLSSDHSIITGNSNEIIGGNNSAIIGGSNNKTTGLRSAIIGGGGGLLSDRNENSGDKSVIIGGSNITNSLNDMVVVPNLRIWEEPVSTNSGEILVRGSNGVVRSTNEITFVGSTAGSVEEVIGGSNINITGSLEYPEVNLDNEINITGLTSTYLYITDNAIDGYLLVSDSQGKAIWTDPEAITGIGGVQGTGTNNNIVRWSNSDNIKDSLVNLDDDGNITGINDIQVNGDAIIQGNVTINGTATTINTENLTVEDPLILLAKNQTGTPTLDSGIMINRGDLISKAFIWDESEDHFTFISTNDSDETQGNITIDNYSTIKVGGFILQDGTEANNNVLISDSNGQATWASSEMFDYTGTWTGSVLFVGDDLKIDEDELFHYDVNSGNLGIGLTDPQSTLDVLGDMQITHNGSTGSDVFVINGVSGELFSVTDTLEGILMTVNNSDTDSIFEVNSDNTIKFGEPENRATITTLGLEVGTQSVLYEFDIFSNSAHIDYHAKTGSNIRSGNLIAAWIDNQIEFTETSTMDIGDTSGISFSMSIDSNIASLSVETSDPWEIKLIIKEI